MKTETLQTRLDTKNIPNNNELNNYSNSKTSQALPKNETSEMILSQTKASLHNFLSNLKKGSTMNDILTDNKKKSLMPEMSNISRISKKRYPDEEPAIVDPYLTINQMNHNNNNNNLDNKIFYIPNIYNKTNNINTYNQWSKNLSQNNNLRNQLRMRKLIDINQSYEKNNNMTDRNYLNNNNYKSKVNRTDNSLNNNMTQYSTVKRTKNNLVNLGYSTDFAKPEVNKNNNIQVVKNISNKLRKLRIENIKNKNDVFSLKQIYNEMQKILLQEISRYAKISKETNTQQLNEIKKELDDYKDRYNLLLETNKKLSEEKDEKEKKIN